jgi:hypothetical protein
MVLASSITDPLRKDPLRCEMQAKEDTAQKTKSTKLQAQTGGDVTASKVTTSLVPCSDETSSLCNFGVKSSVAIAKRRMYASQARRSLVALSRARSRYIRTKSINLALEALDTNELDVDDKEVTSLLLLMAELSDFVEMTIESRKRRIKQPTSTDCPDHVVQKDFNTAIKVDDHIERLIMVRACSMSDLLSHQRQ